ncbi:MAG: 4Fe-4S binding protein [Acidobacteria bacterium]|nr:4Fe-4S binding protein [Acidobacteriota bacterium]
MKRQIIDIDEELCTGCGLCIPNCPEGALQIIDGKARLISDLFCDGLGACIGNCPEGAINTIEREAEPYDENKVMDNIIKQGTNTIKAHLEHLQGHGETSYLEQAIEYLKDKNIEPPEGFGEKKSEHAHNHEHSHGEPHFHLGCPGGRTIDNTTKQKENHIDDIGEIRSELRQWPVQLHLINPGAPYFNNSDLLIAADCTAFTHGDFHRKFLKKKTLIVFCPKLDQATDRYIEKLAMVFSHNNIRSLTMLIMEVPCCGGLKHIVNEAISRSGKSIKTEEITLSLEGEIIG